MKVMDFPETQWFRLNFHCRGRGMASLLRKPGSHKSHSVAKYMNKINYSTLRNTPTNEGLINNI